MQIETDHPQRSIGGQCELVGLSRWSFYYVPADESEATMGLMGLIDEQYTRRSF